MTAEPRVFVLGGNGSGFAFVNSFRADPASPKNVTLTARLVPLAWTPIGVAAGDTWQNVGVALAGLYDWVDRTFPPEDERAFAAPMRDVELLARIGWEAPLPETLDDEAVLNIDDVPGDVVEALALPPTALVQCAACRRLCVRGDFVWKEKELCAWDYHAQVFGKRGPWRNGPYEPHHFETLPRCAYVAMPLLEGTGVEIVCEIHGVAEETARSVVATLLGTDRERAHLAARLPDEGLIVLRESEAPARPA